MNWIEINEDRSNLPEPCVNILITRISQYLRTVKI
jgi:hypothetical protein